MLVLLPDRQITRRKRSHLLVDIKGDVQFAASKLEDLLAWIDEKEIDRIIVETTTDERYLIEVRRFTNLLMGDQEHDDTRTVAAYGEASGNPPD